MDIDNITLDMINHTEYINITSTEDTYESQVYSFDIREIVHILWSAVCVLANILLVFILKRKTSDPMCFIVLFWCLSNLIYIGVWLYFGVVPSQHILYWTSAYFHTVGIIFIYLSEMHALLILSNNIMASVKRCRNFVVIIWILAIASVIFAVLAIHYYNFDQYIKLSLTGAICLACLTTLSAKIIEKDNREFRTLLAGITIISSLLLWCSEVGFHYFGLFNLIIVDMCIVILYGTSIVNLILFVFLDQESKVYVRKLLYLKGNP